VSYKIQFRRGMKKDLPQLDNGEVGYTQDTEELFIGSQNGNKKLTFDANKHQELESKLAQIAINVRTLGAKGDGVTDDTVPIQQALDHVSAQGGGTVFVPYGNYLISSTLKVAGNTTIFGVGRKASLIKLKDGSDCDVLSTYEDGQQRYYLHLRDFGIDGNAQNQSTGTSNGIVVSNVNECVIDNVGVWNPRESAIVIRGIDTNMSTVPMIRNLLLRGDELHTEGDGLALEQGSYDGIVTGCDIGFFKSGSGIKMSYHNGSTISDCNLWQNRFGLYSAHSNRTRLDNILSDYANRTGFYFEESSDLQISNCQSRMSGIEQKQAYDGFYFLSCFRVQISNPKVISAPSGSTYYLDGETAYGIAMSYCQVFRITNFLSSAIKGKVFTDNSTDISESAMTNIT
jgi:hypothetical protein